MTNSFIRADYPQWKLLKNNLDPMTHKPDVGVMTQWKNGDIHVVKVYQEDPKEKFGGSSTTVSSAYIVGDQAVLESTTTKTSGEEYEKNKICFLGLTDEIRKNGIKHWAAEKNLRFNIARVSVLAALGTTVAISMGHLAATALTVSAIALFVIGALLAARQGLVIKFNELKQWEYHPKEMIQESRKMAFDDVKILDMQIFALGYASLCPLRAGRMSDRVAIGRLGYTDGLFRNDFFTKSEKFWIWHHHMTQALTSAIDQKKFETLELQTCFNAITSSCWSAHIDMNQQTYDAAMSLYTHLHPSQAYKKNDEEKLAEMQILLDHLNSVTVYNDAQAKSRLECHEQFIQTDTGKLINW